MNTWHPLPSAVYSFVEATPGSILLETSRPGTSDISRIFTNPVRVFEARTADDVAALFMEIEVAVQRGSFAAGFFAYECGGCFEPTAALRQGGDNDLLAWIGIYQHCYRFDHLTGMFLDEFMDAVPAAFEAAAPVVSEAAAQTLSFGLDEREYAGRIAQIHEWIGEGDVYQLNFTFPVNLETDETPAALYARLVSAQPVEYGAFLHCQKGRHVLCLSPELFFRLEEDSGERRITAQPMKGTARRGRTTTEDREIAAGLAADAKNRAENVMIVDLIRNDLGRICEFGSVRVEKLFDVERYSTLWQMTSTVSGELRPEIGYGQIFRALFPCGSITGAPKVRAMQLLAKIEAEARGIYTGAIGFFSREQTFFNVAIRTLLLESGNTVMGVGGGIVIDSEADAEFRECQLKAEFLTRRAAPFSLIETMLWDGGFPLMELHLDRLADSSNYFGFRCDRGTIKAALLDEAGRFADKGSRKVRLLLDADGAVHIESGILTQTPHGDEGGARVCMAARRSDPEDRFLFHKTTNRGLYDRVFAAASKAGFGDALFLNTRGEVTEGAISNVFIEKAGRWYTPPLDCGVLPGVYRRHLRETRPEIEEKILTRDDVEGADAVYICNAVRGLTRVQLALGTMVE
jgi:para-aminobenzoate synthetase / 4-amino-4-deoxychorismate lyase